MKIMEKEKSYYSEMFQGNVENKPARNKQIIEDLSWPSVTETAKAALSSNKSSTDSLKSLGCHGSSSSSVSFFSQRSSIPAETERMHQKFIEQAIAFIQGESSYGDHLPYTSPSGHIQGNEFASRSHVSTQKGQNQRQHNSYKNQNVSHQSHGGRHNQEHVKQKWNLPRNFMEQGGFLAPSRGGAPEFVRPSPPIPSIYAQYIPVQPFYYPIAFDDLPPPMIYHPHSMPFIDPRVVFFPSQYPGRMLSIEPPPVSVPFQKDTLKTKMLNQVQETPLKEKILNQVQKVPHKTKILNQVQYYLSEDNLPNDVYLRKRMNDEGFVHIEFIAGFNKLKALTINVQLILDSLRDSDIVEVQGYEIRNRRVWRKYIMPHNWRVAFYPRPEYIVANNHQNIQLKQN